MQPPRSKRRSVLRAARIQGKSQTKIEGIKKPRERCSWGILFVGDPDETRTRDPKRDRLVF